MSKNNEQMSNKTLNKILKKIENIEEQIVVDKNKKTNEKKYVRMLPFLFFCIFLVVLLIIFIYKKQNTIIVLEGEPKDITITSFEGNIALDTRMLNIDIGYVMNRDTLTFALQGKEYIAAPHELIIRFDCNKDLKKVGLPYFNSMMTRKYNMYYSTTVSSEYLTAEAVVFERSENTIAYFHNKIIEAGGENRDGKILYVNFLEPKAQGLLQLQKNEIVDLSGGVIVYYKGDVLTTYSTQLEIMNEEFGCSFEFYDLSNLKIYMDEAVGMALNGNIDGIVGELEIGTGKMVCTSPSSQKELYVGTQEIVVEGEELSIEYDFNAGVSEMALKGKADEARLESVDVLEGVAQFFMSNLSNIIMVVVGTLISFGVEGIKKSR